MEIRKISVNDLSNLIEFNKKIYAKRDQIEESINYRFLNNPYYHVDEQKSLIAIENGSIIGQIFMLPSEFKFGKDIHKAYWGMDYIVSSENRGSPAGTVLCKRAVKEKYHFGIGLSNHSLPICLAFQEKIIGKMTKFIRINNFLSLTSILTKRTKFIEFSFPELIQFGSVRFKKVSSPDEINSNNGYWSGNETLEFSRSKDFFKWRFFYYPNKFIVYKLQDDGSNYNSVYFVLRNIVWKNLNCFLLVDYRFNSNLDFNNILAAINKLSRLNNVSAIITGSSMDSIDTMLKRKSFFPFGNKMHIVSNFKDISLEKNSNNKVMVTFADSDCDHYYGNNKW